MEFSILSWNIWLKNQTNANRLKKLESELEELISDYDPDVILLNEVMLDNDLHHIPPVLASLGKNGYVEHHYAPGSFIHDRWQISSSISSKHKMINKETIKLSKDPNEQRKGLGDNWLKAVSSEVKLPGFKIRVVSAHPIYLSLKTLYHHYVGTSALANYLNDKQKEKTDLFIGGDINEPKVFWPNSLESKLNVKFAQHTGTFFNPTWMPHPERNFLMHANLDRIMWPETNHSSFIDGKVIRSKLSDHNPILARFTY